ncbi:MAG TPA: DUF5000 domain-containing lipoprotein [Cyclobacteriaceae bacterium]|nr:DUF5000 domain-containing lipoprotein [Cyclobacteriaceae bacterium]
MKKYIIRYSLKILGSVFISLLFLLTSCDEKNFNDPVSDDHTKPGVITNIEVHNFNGGAYIIYTLPSSDNLLYVSAEYMINEKKSRQTKASYYSDTITVSGFANAAEYDVTLYSVSRANVKSDPVVVKVHPDTPPYQLVKPTITIDTDFGGVNIKAINSLKQPIGLILMAYDSSTDSFEVEDQYYTKSDTINYSVRGYENKEREFRVYVTDQYGNISETVSQTLTPLFEELLDKSKFFTYNLPSDSKIGYGWNLPYLWDDKTDGYSSGWHTEPGGSIPMLCTFGIGVTAKLSRFMLWERPDNFAYGHGNPKNFSIWGSDKSSPQDAALPRYSDVGTVVGDWTNLGNYHFPDPPSGLPPGATNAEDAAFVAAGVNFNVPIGSPAARFIRLCVSDTWSGGDFAHAMEISLYGNPIE